MHDANHTGLRRVFTKLSLLLTLLACVMPTQVRAQANEASVPAAAAPIVVGSPDIPTMRTKLKQLYPATNVESVATTSIPGMYEIVIGRNIAYIDASAKYFIFGHMYDMPAQRDLTASRIETLMRIDFAQLPLGDAIKTVKGTGARKLAVFSDPDCPHCKVLEKSFAEMTDITIYTFLLPIAGLHPQAKSKAIAIWCSKDRSKAWDAFMLKGTLPATAATSAGTGNAVNCDTPLERNAALAQRYKINGTPTLIAADGRSLPGAMPLDRLNIWLSETTAASSGANTNVSAGANANTATTAPSAKTAPQQAADARGVK